MSTDIIDFPEGFLWGTGASAFQVEGAQHEDGRGDSIWDVAFRDGRLKTPDGTGPETAIDQYHRLDEDLDLLADLGASVHRFSVSWPRVVPDGKSLNPAGLDYYERMVDGLLQRGLKPAANLFHWELPQELEKVGGWMNRDTAFRFADYAAEVVARLGDRVEFWFTMNEPTHPGLGGYVAGLLPPFRNQGAKGLVSIHHLLLSHGLAAQAIRCHSASNVGIILSASGVRPATSHPDDQEAARKAGLLIDGLFLDPLLRGTHVEGLAKVLGEDIHQGDMELISQPLDVLGLNWYSSYSVAAPHRCARHLAQAPKRWDLFQDIAAQTPPLGFVIVPEPGAVWMNSHRQITPSGLKEMLQWVSSTYENCPPIIITENGIGLADLTPNDGQRIAYIQRNLLDVDSVIREGIDVRGFWVWSAWDNLQWMHGFTQRFGLIHVDTRTQQRTPKDSFYWFKKVSSHNRLEVEAKTDDWAGELIPEFGPNARDMGGLPTSDGGRIRSGKLIIAGQLEELPDPALPGAINSFSDEILEVLRTLARQKDSPTTLHCTAGKDATGVAVAILLSVLGVPDEAIRKLYAASARLLAEGADASVLPAVQPTENAIPAGTDAEFPGSPESAINGILGAIRQRSCTVRGWLIDNGLEPEVITALQESLVDPDDK